MGFGLNLVFNRKSRIQQDLSNRIFGALKCILKHHSDGNNIYWKTICLWCGAERVCRTYLVKRGHCLKCNHNTTPPVTTEELQ